MKYAIKVYLPDNGWVYVSEGPVDEMRVWTTDSLEKAEEYLKVWVFAVREKVEIVEYQP